MLKSPGANPACGSSGDLIADRRFDYAYAYKARGDHEAARDVLEQIVARVPHWAPAWFALAQAHEALACRDKAIAAFERVRAIDACDVLGASLHLARLGVLLVSAAPTAYVAGLFDQYAEAFDTHLVEKLAYRAPQILGDAVERFGRHHFTHIVDLGCGTGLCGAVFRARADVLTGVDLSPRMIEKAREKCLYDHLAVESLDNFLAAQPRASADLLLAADVLCYVGALESIFRSAQQVLRDDGIFAFTLQSGEDDFRVGHDMRYAHGAAYVGAAAQTAGLAVGSIEEAAIRREGAAEILGLVVILEKLIPRDG